MNAPAPSHPSPQIALDFTDGWIVPPPVDYTALFGIAAGDAMRRTVEIEIGSGNGRYLRRAAEERPDHLFIGIERSLSYARKARDRMVKYGVGNVRIVRADATRFLLTHIPPASADVLHVYFTDPWPKTKHAKRRLFQPAFFDTIHRFLKPGGRIFVKVDLFWYFEEILCRFERCPWMHVTANGTDTSRERDLYAITGFEQKALQKKGATFHLSAIHRP